jgi:threonyl-tRNA synthetase
MAKLELPDGSVVEGADGACVLDYVRQIGAGLAKAAVCAEVDGRLVDLSCPVTNHAKLVVITGKDAKGLEILRHSCAHVMAEAICAIWPGTKLVYGPTVTDGFYYDIDLDAAIRPEDFERIEGKMREIIAADEPFVRVEMGRDEAAAKKANDPYKLDNIQNAKGDVISFYRPGAERGLRTCAAGRSAGRGSNDPMYAFKGDESGGVRTGTGMARRRMLQRV